MLCGVVLTIVGTVFCRLRLGRRALLQHRRSSRSASIVYLCTTILAAIGAHAVHERTRGRPPPGARLRNAQYVMPVAFAVSSALLGGADDRPLEGGRGDHGAHSVIAPRSLPARRDGALRRRHLRHRT